MCEGVEAVVLSEEWKLNGRKFFLSERLVCGLLRFFASARHPRIEAPTLAFERTDGRRTHSHNRQETQVTNGAVAGRGGGGVLGGGAHHTALGKRKSGEEHTVLERRPPPGPNASQMGRKEISSGQQQGLRCGGLCSMPGREEL